MTEQYGIAASFAVYSIFCERKRMKSYTSLSGRSIAGKLGEGGTGYKNYVSNKASK